MVAQNLRIIQVSVFSNLQGIFIDFFRNCGKLAQDPLPMALIHDILFY